MEPWWPQSGWLGSGTAMFLFFNVLIVTVAVLSRGQQGGHGRRLCRSASSMVLGRLRSFSSMFSSVHAEAEFYDYNTTPEAGEVQIGLEVASEPQGLQPEAASTSRAALVEVAGAIPLMEDEAKELTTCTRLDDERRLQGEQHHARSDEAAGESIAAVVEQDGARAKEQPAEEEAPPAESGKRRARSRRREAEESLEGKAELNARAELFIHQFKEDLKLQRLNSIINYTRALRRRAGAALQLSQD